MVKNANYQKFKCDIFNHFQTMSTLHCLAFLHNFKFSFHLSEVVQTTHDLIDFYVINKWLDEKVNAIVLVQIMSFKYISLNSSISSSWLQVGVHVRLGLLFFQSLFGSCQAQRFESHHVVWKSQKKSHSTWRVKRARFTFEWTKVHQKCRNSKNQMRHLGLF